MHEILQDITEILVIALFGFGMGLIAVKVKHEYKTVGFLVWVGLFAVLFTMFVS